MPFCSKVSLEILIAHITKDHQYGNFVHDTILHRTQQQMDSMMLFPIDCELCSFIKQIFIVAHVSSSLIPLISSIYNIVFLSLVSGCTLKITVSLPSFTYLQMYLIDLTELRYSTFMCALCVFNSKGEYGTIHRLSISMSPFCICIIANLLPSSADLPYKANSSFFATVSDTNA
ncbi:unnamed protein product [Onchocerca flexuosa]|uniref:DUF2470 domain-containing protein n=1 Tax=Onchocerca flexuosa TaxID=387005 RepID=A0A183I1K8_9BILA|nr:unnamed protein product [Onchocerca flexuosa]